MSAGEASIGAHGALPLPPGDREARKTIEGIQLDRSGLRKLRRGVIERAMSTLTPVLTVPGLPDAFRRSQARLHVVKALSPYSEAVNQCVRRAWGTRFPQVPL